MHGVGLCQAGNVAACSAETFVALHPHQTVPFALEKGLVGNLSPPPVSEGILLAGDVHCARSCPKD